MPIVIPVVLIFACSIFTFAFSLFFLRPLVMVVSRPFRVWFTYIYFVIVIQLRPLTWIDSSSFMRTLAFRAATIHILRLSLCISLLSLLRLLLDRMSKVQTWRFPIL
jgi:hypothetical protein